MLSTTVKEIFDVFSKPFPEIYQPEHLEMARELNLDPKMVPWEKVIPVKKYSILKKNQDEKIYEILEQIGDDLSYYQNIFLENKKALGLLEPAKIDTTYLKFVSMKYPEEYVRWFKETPWIPGHNGFVNVPEYSLTGSATGRMTVTGGPNILLLPKHLRGVLTSRFGKENGKLWSLDFVSLEPRLVLLLKHYLSFPITESPQISSLISYGGYPSLLASGYNGSGIPEDVYSHALRYLKLSSSVTRDTLKQIVLPQLYGQRSSLIIENLEAQNVDRPEEVLEMVNDFFGISALRQTIYSRLQEGRGKYLKTFYDRHLIPDDTKPHALLNYFIQSTAVDIALRGFSNILSKLVSTKGSQDVIVPVFFLHDALILDVHKSAEYLIPKLCAAGSKNIPGFEKDTFYISGKPFNHDTTTKR